MPTQTPALKMSPTTSHDVRVIEIITKNRAFKKFTLLIKNVVYQINPADKRNVLNFAQVL